MWWVMFLALGGPVDSAHHVRLQADAVVIESRWNDAGAGELAVGLPASVELEQRDDDTLQVVIPLEEVRARGVLPLPIPAGEGVHRVTFAQELKFRPRPPLELAPRGVQSVSRGIHGADLRRVDESFGTAPEGGALARYVSTEDIRDGGGLAGVVQDAKIQRQRLLLLGMGALVGVVSALLAIGRAFQRRAAVERVDAELSREIADLHPS